MPPLLQSPERRVDLVGLGRFELPTSRLSGVRSNQLSYRPAPLAGPLGAPGKPLLLPQN